MARCACGGSTCSCVVTGGSGIEVSGAGSAASPYIIDSTGDFSGSIIAVSSDTVQMTASGEGTQANPLTISARATLEMIDLLDVNDPIGTPAEGEVPVWTTDHWEFKAPASAPPGTINRGAGLLGDGSSGAPLQVASSGVWGQGDMAGFPADSKLGMPIYTDSLGQVRTRPIPAVRHAQQPFAFTSGWTDLGGGYWVQCGNIITLGGLVRRTGASIAGGNIADITVGNLIAAVPKPLSGNHALSPWGGYLHASALTAAGVFVLGGLPAGTTFVGGTNGAYLSFQVTYIGNVAGSVIL